MELFIRNDNALKWIDDIEKQIFIIKNNFKSKREYLEVQKIELMFFYCKGRYLIRAGDYTLGTKDMYKVINMSKDLNDLETELLGHKQMTIYGIQINDPRITLNHILSSIRVARRLNNNQEMAVLYRLKGVYHIMEGEFSEAERLINQSIEQFMSIDSPNNSNCISIAACYNYIGEIRTAEGKFDEAMEYFIKAINMCQNVEISCLSIFYINAGKISYLMGNISGMKDYFSQAEKIVGRFDTFWKHSLLDAFLALIYFLEREEITAVEYLKSAVSGAKTLNNPRDIGMVYFVETIIKSMILSDKVEKKGKMDDFLKESIDLYYYKAIEYLDAKRDKAEIEYLKEKVII